MVERLAANLQRQTSLRRSERGFSLLEMILVVTIVSVLTGIAVGITPNVVRAARGDSGAQELDAFLKRQREMAIARRRDIEIRFLAPNRVQSAQRPVPDPVTGAVGAATVLETLTFEGGIEYWRPEGDLEDTPMLFGNEDAIEINGRLPVMFSSEGAFIDARNDPATATLTLGIEGDTLTTTAVTILGTTATIQRWQWNGSTWTR